ncbi:hypothetical protein Tco_1471165, partial [Tanacetum coccineum]
QPITGPLILLDVVVLAKQVWCNYLNNDLKKRIVVFAGGFNRNTKLGSKEILLLSYVLAVLTLAILTWKWMKELKCLRLMCGRKDYSQAKNGLKYLSTIIVVITRTIYVQRRGITMRIIAAS